MDGADDARAREECPEQGEAERQDDQGQVPELEHAPALLDHHRVQERRAREPGHEGRVLHGIPGPVAAPAEHVVAPPPADEEAEGEEVPGHDRPAPRDGDPLVPGAPHDERGHGEGEGDAEPREAEIERHGVRDHPGVFEERIEPPPVGGDGRQALERRGGDAHHEEKEGKDAQHDREDPGIELGLPAPVADDHDQRVDREHPRPEDDGALEGAPEGGDAVVEGRAAISVHGHVAHGEVEGQEGVEHEGDTSGDEDPDADGGPFPRAQPVSAARSNADHPGDRPVERQHEPDHCCRVTQLRDHLPLSLPRSDFKSSL